MKLTIYSDLHLEFGDFEPSEGEVCVLAGDICTAVDFKHKNGDVAYFYRSFLNDISKNFDKTFYVMGNHEHYHGDINESESLIRDILPDNISLLNNQSELYNGVHFIGSTMWTDFNNGLHVDKAQMIMNDYHLIQNGKEELIPLDTLIMHDETIEWFNQVLPTLRGKKVVITHHAPSLQSVKGRYLYQKECYATNLSRLIEYHCPDLWVHGHIHHSNDYNIESTRIVSNPRGYVNNEVNPEFNPNFVVDIG